MMFPRNQGEFLQLPMKSSQFIQMKNNDFVTNKQKQIRNEQSLK